jgi:hypothetical protein
MQVVADLEGEPFLPIPTEDLLVNLVDARAVVDTLLDNLPAMVASNHSPDSALGAALQVTPPQPILCFLPSWQSTQ